LIDFRYHLVSIVAVFLALAIGIVLGSTELQGNTLSVLNSTSNSLRSQLSAASTARNAYAAQASAADAFVATSESLLLGQGHLLAGQELVVIAEPGAPGAVTDGVKKAAVAAGATVTGQVTLQAGFNDLSGATESTLSSINGSIAASDGTPLNPGTDPQTTYQQQAAQLIAGAILAKAPAGGTAASPGAPGTQATDGGAGGENAQTLLKAYAQAGFITFTGTPASRATLAVIVTPGSVPAAASSDPANEVLVAIAGQFAAASSATAVAGAATPSGQAGSAISVVRSSSASGQVSTIDDADSTQGQITVMQAIARQLAGGKASSYGISGASSVSPSPVPTPSASASATPTTQATGKPPGKPKTAKQVRSK
jgi:hypothetical protein